MNAKAIVCDEKQQVTLQEVCLPAPGPGDVVLRTLYSGISIGTESNLLRGRVSWGPYPLCTGYMAVGVVERVGADVTTYTPGQAVYFRGNPAMAYPDGRPISPVAGTHCSHAVMGADENPGLGMLPDDVPLDAASSFVLLGVGLHGVDMAQPRFGDHVVVHGVGLVGLSVVAWCAARGARVMAVDRAANRLAVARTLGAEHLIDASTQDVAAEVKARAPEGADIVFEASGVSECVDIAVPLCRDFGKFVWQGDYGDAPLTWHWRAAHARHLTTFFPCNDGLEPARRAVLHALATGMVNWTATITHRVTPEQAPDLFMRILKGEASDVMGATIRWDASAAG